MVKEKKIDMSTILVVEDEPNVRKFVTVNLAHRGHKVIEAKNGQLALEQLIDQKPELLILDIKLPDLSGWDILNRINTVPARSADFPVLVMTASPVDENNILEQYPSVVEILMKPFNTAQLMTAIQRALSKTGTDSI
jgi:two-component system response regulator AdeR